MMDSRQSNRKYKIRTIKNILLAAQERGKRISKERLIADISIKSGLARRTILEYLQVLIQSNEAHYEEEKDGEVAIVLGADKHKTIDFNIQTLLDDAIRKERQRKKKKIEKEAIKVLNQEVDKNDKNT